MIGGVVGDALFRMAVLLDVGGGVGRLYAATEWISTISVAFGGAGVGRRLVESVTACLWGVCLELTRSLGAWISAVGLGSGVLSVASYGCCVRYLSFVGVNWWSEFGEVCGVEVKEAVCGYCSYL